MFRKEVPIREGDKNFLRAGDVRVYWEFSKKFNVKGFLNR